ncbi:K02A2.6-like [Cordylochernes scorpioides]|uniref:K02A2.6-like n=1 Tax=Cordylochernes scorpioides TaxID=51811 RepID=A0ABY6LA71_9ARAC|nr:K02A2.6-like [Cordylochernes scorpioides]
MRQKDRFIRNWKPHRVVNEGQAVIARGYHGPRWLPGVVQEKLVETDDGEILNRHLDQVRVCGKSEATPSTSSTPQESTKIEDPQAGQEIDPTGEASGPILRRSSRLRRPSKFFEIKSGFTDIVKLEDRKTTNRDWYTAKCLPAVSEISSKADQEFNTKESLTLTMQDRTPQPSQDTATSELYNNTGLQKKLFFLRKRT